MKNIIVDLNTPIYHGMNLVFRSPVDCSQITGLLVHYKENGNTLSKEFAFADAHGYNVGDIDHLFAEDAVVKVILDMATSKAFVQNADTNAYLEQRFDDIEENISPIVCDAVGETIVLSDASNKKLKGLTVYGKTTQDGTPTPDAPVALVSVGDDGSVTVSVTDGTEENVQTVEVQTPNGLHGFSVNNGGNYTDSSGKQWTCDYIDFARGVYVKRIERYTFTGNETINKYGNVNKNGFGRWQTSVGTDKSTFTDQATKVSSLCNKYKATSGNMLAGEINNGGTVYQFAFINTRNVAFSTDTMDLDAFRAELAGTTILYRLATPIEIPLTEEELAAYAALRTYKPNTTIFNDAGTGMEASYVADTKTYIDNKFAELAAAIVNNT